MLWQQVFFLLHKTASECIDDGIAGQDASLLQLRLVHGHKAITMDEVESREQESEQESEASGQVLSSLKKLRGERGADRQRARKNNEISSTVRPSNQARECLRREKEKCEDLVKRKNEKKACREEGSSKCSGRSIPTHPQVTLQTPPASGCPKEFVFESQTKPICLKDIEDLPKAWQPSGKQLARFGRNPWTAADQALANQSLVVALDEMIAYQAAHPRTIKALGTDSVESYIDFAFDASNMPKLRDRAVAVAIERLAVIAEPYNNSDAAGFCVDAGNLLELLIYAHNLRDRTADGQKLNALHETLTSRLNEAIRDCGTFSNFLGYDPEVYFALARMGNGKIYDMVMWAVLFLDALAIPDVVLPEETKPFVTRVWRYLASYPKPAAKSFAKGADDPLFFDLAYLMTHAGYVPTGYGRYELCLSDGTWLYQFLRANFYAVIEMGELDLTSEFVDIFRQYGCTEDNDRQVRDGARYLLDAYEKAGRSWIKHRESYEKKAPPSSYELMHKPWTAGGGLRRRVFEPVEHNSYGHYARRLLRD